MNDTIKRVAIIGAGLAGCECAWQLARAGVAATVFEMRPQTSTPAHETGLPAELVCSNSFRSEDPHSAVGLLKLEMADADSLVMAAAEATRVPAGKALAVDRLRFSEAVAERLAACGEVEVVHKEIGGPDDPCLAGFDRVVVAAGPLASAPLADALSQLLGTDHLYFYDAIAPIVAADSVDMDTAFWGSRYRPEDDDYLNCPFDEATYKSFVAELVAGEKVPPREFEKEAHFEACLPIEEMAARGEMTLAFGPLKPVGLSDPRTGERPFAVLQLRAENLERTAFNLVGFQTKLTWPEQRRIFRMIPGLEQAQFLRLGQIHRNTFVDAPACLADDLSLKARPGLHLAGQITGVEGYVESAACGLWLGRHLAGLAAGKTVPLPPPETALGALLGHLRTPAKRFQPSNVNFGLMPALAGRVPKKMRKEHYAKRARRAFADWLAGEASP